MAETEFGPRKTIFILAIVAGCFAVLWPKVFYPMLTTPVTPRQQPDSSTCCDVIFNNDINTVDILQEICRNILKHHEVDPRIRGALNAGPLSPQGASLCREEVLSRCGIDLSSFLAEKERLGKSHKQVLEEIHSYNSSICLKLNFGVPLSQLGTPHLIRYHILMPHNTIRQERQTPSHAGILHPAMRERGRAIPSSHIVPKIKDRQDHVSVPVKTRPTIGGPGHVVPASTKGGGGGMGLIMPLYTVGIVLFFLYTMSRVLRKSSDSEIISSSGYIREEAEREFQKMVFNPEVFTAALTGGATKRRKNRPPSPLGSTPTLEELQEQAAGDIEIDQLRRRLVETEAAMERIVVQMGNFSRGVPSSSPRPENKDGESGHDFCCEDDELTNHEHDESSATVKVLGMEMTASSEDGQKCSRPTTPIMPPASPSHLEREKTPPKPIYLEGSLPAQCELLVTDSETRTEQEDDEHLEASVVLSGKMTLSLINVEQESENNENGKVKEKKECRDGVDDATYMKFIMRHHVDEMEEEMSGNEDENDTWSNDEEKYSEEEPLEE